MSLFCDICNVRVPSDVVMKSHLEGKRHLRRAEEQRKRRDEVECSVFVRGFPPGTTEAVLRSCFSRFGKVTNIFLENERGHFAFVQFQSRETVSVLLSPQCTVRLGNSRLSIKPRQSRPATSSPKPPAPPEPPREAPVQNSDDLLQKLCSCADVAQQMTALQNEIELSDGELQQRDSIRQQLQYLFQGKVPGCQVLLFGSSVNGVGMHGCDMDIFLDVAADDSGAQTNDQLSTMHNSVSRLLRRCRGFRNVFIIRSARCPLVKFEHAESGLMCDLSMNNKLALQNTRLIKLACDIDPRVQPLMFNVRYWAKVKCLVGGANGQTSITNYALTMMVIFYLQQLDVPVLPSVEQLAKLANDDGETCIIDGWNCAFCSNLDKLRPMAAADTDSVSDLLHGFFRFYTNLDHGNHVLCTRMGKVVAITSFTSDMKEDERLSRFKVSLMCVQDPFVLDHNVTSNVHARVSERFTAEVKAASHAFSQPDFSVPTLMTPWGIARVLAAATLVNQNATPAGSSSDGYGFTVVMETSKLPTSYVERYSGVTELKEGWSCDLCALIRKMLEDVFYFECKEIEAEGSGVSKDVSSKKKVIDATHESLNGKVNTIDASSSIGLSSEAKNDKAVSKKPIVTTHESLNCELTTTDASGSIGTSSTKIKVEASGEIRDESSEKKPIVATDECLNCKPNTTDISGSIGMSSTDNGTALTISNVSRGEIQMVNDLNKAASSQEIGKENVEVLPCRTASGEVRRTREEMEGLDLTSDASSEPGHQREPSDGGKMESEECQVGKRSSSGDLGEERISKRSRGEGEDKSPCCTASDMTVTESNADIDHMDEPSSQTIANAGQCDMGEENIISIETANPDIIETHSPVQENMEVTVACTAAPSAAIGGAEINTGSPKLPRSGSLCCLHCSAKSSVWMGRKKFKKDSSLTGLDAEVQISEMVASELAKIPDNGVSNNFSFRLKFTAQHSCGKTALVVSAHPTTGAKTFGCFFTFFKSFVSKHTHLAFT